jgi:hypothetical protein
MVLERVHFIKRFRDTRIRKLCRFRIRFDLLM